ncbi:MAG TPA: DUF2723 domain-containing protein [Bacteroidota bacterium]|nr:DUF2723 domain-containing protein [Bacteroidota bacterium]
MNRIVGVVVFVVSLATYLRTISPTVVFWDVGEFCAAAFSLQVPHPPGAPLFLLLARLSAMIPVIPDIAVRMHILSAIGSAVSCAFLYFITVRFIRMWRGIPESTYDRIVVFGSAAIGALSLTFSKTFWFNAVEAEVYGLSMMFISGIVLLGLKWYASARQESGDRYLLLIAYIVGLSVGVHLLVILTVFFVMVLFYFRYHEFSFPSLFKFGAGALVVFAVIYPGVVKELPSMLDGEIGGTRSELIAYLPLVLLVAAAFGVWYSVKHRERLLNLSLLSFIFIVLGYSTYAVVYVRANAHTPMNENDPSTLTHLVSYLNREQYGSAPLLDRRWDTEPEKRQAAQNYTGDLDYFLRFQLNHMYWRYHLWNYVGVDGDQKDAGWSAKDFYFVPLILGFFGAWYHWRKDWKMASAATVLFVVMGLALVVYFNMQDPQPRERDYFYVGSYFVFSMWIGVGLLGVVDLLKEKLAWVAARPAVTYGVLALGFVLVPATMLRVNFKEADRSGNYVAWDYSYNLLQSCEPDAILFTNGDNDTFPLWYLQDVEGIRRDVRIVNLSLVNTSWYIKQLKHERPYGAREVPISLQDAQIDKIQPIAFEPRTMELPTSPDVVKRFVPESTPAVMETSVVRSGVLRWTMPNTMVAGNVKAIRAQDIMVYDIIRSSNWERPIYFAMTVGDDGKIGLREYMQLRGIAYKLVPQHQSQYGVGLNEAATTAGLMTDIKEALKTPSPGFRWRGLQDSTTYFDEDVRRLMSNYRGAFVSLALYCSGVLNQPARATEILNRMEKLLPHRILPMDPRLKFDLAHFYSSGRDSATSRAYTTELIRELEPVVAKRQKERINYYSNYIMLLHCYLSMNMIDKATDLVTLVKGVYAGEQGLDGFIAQLNAQIALSRNPQGEAPAENDTTSGSAQGR